MSLLRSVLLACAVCTDTFFAALGCAMDGIRVGRRASALIAGVGALCLGLSLLLAAGLGRLVPATLFRIGGAVLLACIGGIRLLKSSLTAAVRHHRPHWNLRALGLVIDICFDETACDTDGSKTLSLPEALRFALALSLDSLCCGLGAGIDPVYVLPCLGLTALLGYGLTRLGAALGSRISRRIRCSWLGAVMLLLLAIVRLL